MNEITKKDAIRFYLFDSLKDKQIKEVDALIDMIELTKEQYAYLIYRLMKDQRKRFSKVNKSNELRTLIQFPECAIVGSGRCERCDGALGRLED